MLPAGDAHRHMIICVCDTNSYPIHKKQAGTGRNNGVGRGDTGATLNGTRDKTKWRCRSELKRGWKKRSGNETEAPASTIQELHIYQVPVMKIGRVCSLQQVARQHHQQQQQGSSSIFVRASPYALPAGAVHPTPSK